MAVCNSDAHRPHCRPAVSRTRAASRYVDCVDSSDTLSVWRWPMVSAMKQPTKKHKEKIR